MRSQPAVLKVTMNSHYVERRKAPKGNILPFTECGEW